MMGWLIALAALALILVGGIAIHDVLTGRRLLLDLFDIRRLRRLSLAECDSFWAANPQRSQIIVCLTTTPTRIQRLDRTLKSLLTQSVAPLRIRLHLPGYSVREQRVYPWPAFLNGLRSLEVVQCQDSGPSTKLLPALADLAPDQLILVVDDDRLYPPGLLAEFAALAERFPNAALCGSGWRVPLSLCEPEPPAWARWIKVPPFTVKSSLVERPVQVDILQGYTSYLVRPRFFDLEKISNYDAAPPEAFSVDDIWISAHCQVPRLVCPMSRLSFLDFSDWFFYAESALFRINQAHPNPSQRPGSAVMRFFKARWMAWE